MDNRSSNEPEPEPNEEDMNKTHYGRLITIIGVNSFGQ